MFKISLLCLMVFCISAFLPASIIHTMIDDGDIDGIRKELTSKPDLLEEKNENLLSPLNYAVCAGNLEMTKLLVSLGADVHSGDREGSQPLINAAAMGNLEITRYLVEHSAEIDRKDDNDNTALCFALVRNQSEIAIYLLEQGADPNITKMNGLPGLFFAVINGDLPLVKQMIEKSAVIDTTIVSGVTPLVSACTHGHLDIVKYLIEQGANIEKEDDQGRTPIFWAAMRGQSACVEYLISAGADVNKVNNEGETPVFLATGDLTTLKLLQESGGDIHKLNNAGSNLLINIGWNGNVETLTYLVKQVDVNQFNDYGTSGFYFAIQQDSLELVKIFLENGAEPNFGCLENWQDNITQMPSHIASENGYPDMLKLLANHGTDLNKPDLKKGRTPLHYAAAGGFYDLAEYLLESGVDYNSPDTYNMTPLDIASRYGYENIQTLLLKYGANPATVSADFQNINPHDCRIIYTGHSGWVLETSDHILVFDYWKRNDPPAGSSIKSGCLTREFLVGNKPVSFLVSHIHEDHYDQRIFEFADLPNVEYLFGFNPGRNEEITLLNAREPLLRDDFEIYPIYSNDSGVGFLVEVDGLVIFHPGDHANRNRDLSGDYLPEIEYIKSLNKDIDLAFMPISGCNFGDIEAVRIGVYKTLDILQPRYFIPMHSGGNEARYGAFNLQLTQDGYNLDKFSAKDSGDRFIYSY
ncbi:MAG: ankyrin repeat domain-containing protein [Candidatus Cloacimonetes bacterium]|nr:ankyrin repeat domain-containing protein [Candidatus Cloacimonadota bacterium]